MGSSFKAEWQRQRSWYENWICLGASPGLMSMTTLRKGHQPALEEDSDGHPDLCPTDYVIQCFYQFYLNQEHRLNSYCSRNNGIYWKDIYAWGPRKSQGTQPQERQESRHLCDNALFTFPILPLTEKSLSVCCLLYLPPCQLATSGYLYTYSPRWPFSP